MGLSRYLAAILDLCKLGGFPTGVEFQQINTCHNTPFTNILAKKLFGNNLVHRLVKNHLKCPYYKYIRVLNPCSLVTMMEHHVCQWGVTQWLEV